jgi:cytochrome c553
MRQHKQPVQKAISSKAGSHGICGFCHDMHGAGSKHFLWAAPFGASVPQQWSGAAEQTDLCTSGYCTGCHGDNNISAQELPEFGMHPAAYAPRPLSGMTTDHSRSHACMIVCSTCHNPHQWAPGKHSNSTGTAPSGNAANSFLRHNTAASLCAICHGLDGLLKYTYFHSSASRAQQKKPFPFEKRPELSE